MNTGNTGIENSSSGQTGAQDGQGWFVYMGDHHEGPFSLQEMRSKLDAALITTSSYVWAEGMTDWKMLSEVDSLRQSLMESAPAEMMGTVDIPPTPVAETAPTPGAAPQGSVDEPVFVMDLTGEGEKTSLQTAAPSAPATSGVTTLVAAKNVDAAPQDKVKTTPGVSLDMDAVAAASTGNRKKRGFFASLLRTILVLIVLVGVGAGGIAVFGRNSKNPFLQMSAQMLKEVALPIAQGLAEKIPFLNQFVSPIPALKDVSPEDYARLREAAQAPLDLNQSSGGAGGPRIAIALSQTSVTAPAFYIATNLPEGTLLELHVRGVPNTLLNQLSFSSKLSPLTVQGHFVATPPLKFPDGRSLAKGEYTIYAVEAVSDQPAAVQTLLSALPLSMTKVPEDVSKGPKVVTMQKVFLGGKNDDEYRKQLDQYHEQVRARATEELKGIQQFYSSLDSQLAETIKSFDQLRSKGAKTADKSKKGWSDFTKKWSNYQAELRKESSSWKDPIMKGEVFYGELYTGLQLLLADVDQVHEFQNEFFVGKEEKPGVDIQLGESLARAQASLTSIKLKISEAEQAAAASTAPAASPAQSAAAPSGTSEPVRKK